MVYAALGWDASLYIGTCVLVPQGEEQGGKDRKHVFRLYLHCTSLFHFSGCCVPSGVSTRIQVASAADQNHRVRA